MNILITGATGFIGRYLAEALSQKYFVRGLVRKTSDITELKELNVDIVYGDLLDNTSLSPALQGIDLVYHLAGEVYSRKKKDYYTGNVLATQNLLKVCQEKEVKKIIFLSTIGVYKPIFNKILLTEESECKPITYYGQTKLESEELIKESNIPWVIVRAPVIYGPRQPDIVNKLFIDIIKKKKVYIIGDGKNLRSLCFIQNLIDGLLILAKKININNKIYILSDDLPYTFNEIISIISTITGLKIKIVHLPNIFGTIAWIIYRAMFVIFKLCFVKLYSLKTMQMDLGFDINKTKLEIQYSPSKYLNQGFNFTIDWVRTFITNSTI